MNAAEAEAIQLGALNWYEPEPNTGCWIFTGALNTSGYGVIDLKGNRSARAHRIFLASSGVSIDGLVTDHICRVRCCVNPKHLRAVSRATNNVENSTSPAAINRAKTHCKHGHPFSPENTVFNSGYRVCSACKKRRAAEWWVNKRLRQSATVWASQPQPIEAAS